MPRTLSSTASRLVFASPTLTLIVALVTLLGACGGGPDPRTLEGATAYATLAIQEGDARRLFKVIDSRSRHAMISIVSDRRAAREAIVHSYPEAERAPALATLGDAADARDAADLFTRRCTEACMEAFRGTLGAPTTTRVERVGEAEITVVHTTRDADVRFYRKHASDWWGLVWNVDALVAERDRANRDLGAIQENAATYDRRRALGTP